VQRTRAIRIAHGEIANRRGTWTARFVDGSCIALGNHELCGVPRGAGALAYHLQWYVPDDGDELKFEVSEPKTRASDRPVPFLQTEV
jgi:hypothetical protein